MKNMKWVVSLLLITAIGAPAMAHKSKGKLIQHIEIPEELGTLKIDVIEKNEPVTLPYRVTVQVQCKGQKVRTLLDNQGSCKFAGHEWDKEKKRLVVEYWITTTLEGPSECDTQVKQPYNLTGLCR